MFRDKRWNCVGCMAVGIFVVFLSHSASAVSVTPLEQARRTGEAWIWDIVGEGYEYRVEWDIEGQEKDEAENITSLLLLPKEEVGVYTGKITITPLDAGDGPGVPVEFQVTVYVYKVTALSGSCDPFTIELPTVDQSAVTSALDNAATQVDALNIMA